MSELFEIPVSESPRLKWIRTRDVRTHFNKDIEIGEEEEFSGDTLYPWCAFTGGYRFPRPDAGYGNTEDEAIVSLAKLKGWRLWNEEIKP